MDKPVLGASILSRPPVAIGASPYIGRNPLLKYFDSVDAGPGIWKWSHYFDVYHKHLARFRGTNATIVEVLTSAMHEENKTMDTDRKKNQPRKLCTQHQG